MRTKFHWKSTVDRADWNTRCVIDTDKETAQKAHRSEALAQIFREHGNDRLLVWWEELQIAYECSIIGIGICRTYRFCIDRHLGETVSLAPQQLVVIIAELRFVDAAR